MQKLKGCEIISKVMHVVWHDWNIGFLTTMTDTKTQRTLHCTWQMFYRIERFMGPLGIWRKFCCQIVWFLGHKCRAKLESEGSPKTKDLRQGNSQIQPRILGANISHLRDLPILKQENPKSALGLFFFPCLPLAQCIIFTQFFLWCLDV